MTYIRVQWFHTNVAEPVWLYSELDDHRWEARKVYAFADGHAEWADAHHGTNQTWLSLEPIPSLAEINAQAEFDAVEIAGEEFERVWAMAQNSSAGTIGSASA